MKSQRMSWRGLGGRFVLVAVVMGLSTVLFGSSTADAQQGQGKYITQAAADLATLVGKANAEGYSLHSDKFSIGGGWIKQGATNWVSLYTLNLTAGKKYRFLGAGDGDAQDVDIEIRDGTGKVVGSDTSTASTALVDLTPAATGKYLVRMRLYASRNNLPCVCLVLAMSKK